MLKAFLLMVSVCLPLITLINILVGLRYSWDIPTFSKNMALQTYNNFTFSSMTTSSFLDLSQTTPNIWDLPKVQHANANETLLREMELANWGKVLHKPSRVLCAVPTLYPEHAHRLKRIASSWGPLCDKLVWVVGKNSAEFPNTTDLGGENLLLDLTLPQRDKNKHIWEKTHHMVRALAEKYVDKAEWFAKLDDDTFAMPRNIHNFVQFYNPNVPHFLGHTLLHLWKTHNIVFNAGSSYVLSRGAVLKLSHVVKKMSFINSTNIQMQCVDRPGAAEDVQLAVCLRSVGIFPGNTLDHLGRQRFLPFQLEGHVRYMKEGHENEWFWMGKPKNNDGGENCCVSDICSSHSFKRTHSAEDARFFKLHEKYHSKEALTSAEKNITIPPPPRLFDYNPDYFGEVDEFRNLVGAPSFCVRYHGFDNSTET